MALAEMASIPRTASLESQKRLLDKNPSQAQPLKLRVWKGRRA